MDPREDEPLFELLKSELSSKRFARAKASMAKARTRDSMLIVPLEDLVPAGRERGEVEASCAVCSGPTGGCWRRTGSNS